MNKVISLKLASMILFWFGVVAMFFISIATFQEYATQGYIERLTPPGPSFFVINVFDFIWVTFGHMTHIISGYFLAKGNKGGFIFAIIISLWEVIGVAVIIDVLSPFGIAVRIIFAFVLFLLIYKRKELISLQSSNWRPWKNPTKIV